MTDETFRLPDSSYEQIARIIVGFGEFQRPVSPIDVAKVAGLDATTISRNSGFLVGIGVLDGTRQKMLTPEARGLARALDHNIDGDIAKMWRQILADNEFVQKVLAAVRIRKGMDRTALQSHIAYSAGQSRTAKVLTGALAVIDILKAAVLLTEEGGRLTIPTSNGQGQSPDGQQPAQQPSETAQGQDSIGEHDAASRFQKVPDAQRPLGPTVAIQIQVTCSVEELDALGPKLRRVLADLSSPEGEPSAQVEGFVSSTEAGASSPSAT